MTVVNAYAGVMSTHEVRLSLGWAKSGEMVLQVNSIDSGTITQMSYSFGYAYHAYTLTPSVSISNTPSLGISFSSGMKVSGIRSCTYDQNGNLTSY